jgi:bacillithiol system protein YtxJ
VNRTFVELRDFESLDRFLQGSNGGPIVIFKHSDSCGISGRAFTDLMKLQRPIGIITVQDARSVSDEVERRTGIAHETPQILIVREGRVVWSASHGSVRAETVERALAELGSAGIE